MDPLLEERKREREKEAEEIVEEILDKEKWERFIRVQDTDIDLTNVILRLLVKKEIIFPRYGLKEVYIVERVNVFEGGSNCLRGWAREYGFSSRACAVEYGLAYQRLRCEELGKNPHIRIIKEVLMNDYR